MIRIGKNAVTPYLFVYGTLMRAAAGARLGAAERARLAASGEWFGPATTDGRLFDLGRYPALVMSQEGRQFVRGEVYRLRAPCNSLQWLDAYEGIQPGASRGHEYARVSHPVRSLRGQTLVAWLYIFTGTVADARPLPHPLPGGRWLPR